MFTDFNPVCTYEMKYDNAYSLIYMYQGLSLSQEWNESARVSGNTL